MKKLLAAFALSGSFLMVGCAGTASAQTSAPSTAAAVPSAAVTTAQAAAGTPSSDTLEDAVAQGLKDQIRAGAGKTPKYLPAVRKTVKKGTDDELIDYGVKICTSGSGAGINRVISEMTSKGYTIDEANVVALSAGFFICPMK